MEVPACLLIHLVTLELQVRSESWVARSGELVGEWGLVVSLQRQRRDFQRRWRQQCCLATLWTQWVFSWSATLAGDGR